MHQQQGSFFVQGSILFDCMFCFCRKDEALHKRGEREREREREKIVIVREEN